MKNKKAMGALKKAEKVGKELRKHEKEDKKLYKKADKMMGKKKSKKC